MVAAGVVLLAGVFGVLRFSGGGGGDSLRGLVFLQTGVDDIVSGNTSFEGSWDSCRGTGGYDDLRPGASVTIRDDANNIVGTANLESVGSDMLADLVEMNDASGWYDTDGSPTESDISDFLKDSVDTGFSCVFYFESDIKDRDFYEVEVSSRGALSYSKEELKDRGNIVVLSLGGD